MQKVEILAPAGDYECFLAAIRAGADAVYLGGNYSARAYAKNFNDEEILSAIDYAHFHNRKVYMTLNIVMKQDELNTIIDYIAPFYEAGLDGVIVQDIGLISLLRNTYPNLPIHASTQMTITDSDGVLLLKDLGIERVVLARELSLSEISSIKQKTGVELECFIHGALCYSYSGKCFMSGILGGRSGNRGRCAGTCRLPFNDEYPLSCKDICTLKILPSLIEAGINSFKIEGRMKSPEYVAGVTGIYKKYVELYYSIKDLRDDSYEVKDEDLYTLLQLYTRSGNCEGYYNQRNGRHMITLSQPGYVKADEELSHETYMQFTSEDIDRTVNLDFLMKKDSPMVLTASSDNYYAVATGPVPLIATNRPLAEGDVCKQLNKLGGTDFKIGELNIEMDDNLFVPVGKLNEVRREAILGLKKEILSGQKRASVTYDYKKNDKTKRVTDYSQNKVKFHVYTKTLNQVKSALLLKKADIVSIDYLSLINDKDVDELFDIISDDDSVQINIIMPSIVRNDFARRHKMRINRLLENKVVSGIIVDNYELLRYFSINGYKGHIMCDLHMYALNNEACDVLVQLGADKITTPIELNRAELLNRGNFGEDMIIYGYYPLMVSAQCVQTTRHSCDKSCSHNILRDRMNKEFVAVSECAECQSIIYNSVPVSLHKDVDLISRLRPDSVRLMFTTEDSKRVYNVINGFYDLIYNGIDYNPDFEYTRGHLLRGVE